MKNDYIQRYREYVQKKRSLEKYFCPPQLMHVFPTHISSHDHSLHVAFLGSDFEVTVDDAIPPLAVDQGKLCG